MSAAENPLMKTGISSGRMSKMQSSIAMYGAIPGADNTYIFGHTKQ